MQTAQLSKPAPTSPRLLSIVSQQAFARGHWSVESMRWILDLEFAAVVRRFALGLVRANKTKGSIKTSRKTAGRNPQFLLQILQLK